MATQHPDAEHIDRIGRKAVRDHFGLSRQRLYYWRKRGIPTTSRRPLKLLGESLAHDMSEFPIEHEQ